MKVGERSRDLFVADSENVLIMRLDWIDLTSFSQFAPWCARIFLLQSSLISVGNLRIVGHLKMHVAVLIKTSQFLLSLFSFESVADADDGHDDQDSNDGSGYGCPYIGWFRTIVIVAIGVFIDAI